MHSNAFLFTEGRWHTFNSACAFNRSIVYSILRLLNNEKYFFKNLRGKTLSLEEIAKGDFVARFEQVGSHCIKVSGHFTIRIFHSFAPKKSKQAFTLRAPSARVTFSQGWTAINGVCC